MSGEARQAEWRAARVYESWLVVPVRSSRGWFVVVYPPNPYGRNDPIASGKPYSSPERAIATGKAEVDRRKFMLSLGQRTDD